MARRGRKRRLESESQYWELLLPGMGTFKACEIVGTGRRPGASQPLPQPTRLRGDGRSFTRSGRWNPPQNPMRWDLTVNGACLWEQRGFGRRCAGWRWSTKVS